MYRYAKDLILLPDSIPSSVQVHSAAFQQANDFGSFADERKRFLDFLVVESYLINPRHVCDFCTHRLRYSLHDFSVQKCVRFCDDEGEKYAGTQWGQE